MSRLFEPLTLRNLTIKNRLWMSPMCQYSSKNGMPTDWHRIHLGSRAVGGAGLIMVEASGVSPVGRISPDDSGIWSADHARAFQPITQFIRDQGTVAGIQLAHAGRKASTYAPQKGDGALPLSDPNAWQPLGPSAIAFDPTYTVPHAMSVTEIADVVGEFADAARHSLDAGFEVVEVHMAHGYLAHSFLSPLSNHRSDAYGGAYENRTRFPLEVASAVRAVWPQHLPVFARISASDWVDGGWDIDQSVRFSRELKALGIDLIDCSSGGNVATAKIPLAPSYQVPFAEAVRHGAKIPTAAVGLITESKQAEEILAAGKADAIFLGRELLRDPYFPLRAAHELEAEVIWPSQYQRGKFHRVRG